MKEQTQGMLDEILASGKPQGFDEIDVSVKVAGHFPVGTPKAEVMHAFGDVEGALIYEKDPDALTVRYDRGKAMMDVDPRTIVMKFAFDPSGALISVHAVHVKNQ